MGRYADPHMVVDKRFEKAQAQLDKMYTNIGNNIDKITARKQARRKAQAAKMSSYLGRYTKETAEGRKAANAFAQTRDMAGDKKQKFSDDLAGMYDQGYDNITAFIKGKMPGQNGRIPTDAEIEKYVNQQINDAGNLSRQILAFEGLVTEYKQGVLAAESSPDDKPGSAVGSNVIGGEYDGILSTAGVDGDNNAILWDQMSVSGSLNSGVNIFFDDPDTEGGTIGVADKTEILNLGPLVANYGDGKTKMYIEHIKSDEEIYTAAFRQNVKLANKNKKNNFTTEVSYTDEKGNTVVTDVVDAAKRQDYFLNGDGKDLLNSRIDGNEIMLVQKYFGADAAAEFDVNNEQDMMKLRVRVLEANDNLMEEGDSKLVLNKTSRSTQFTKNTSADVVGDYYKDVHDDVSKLSFGGQDDAEKIKEFNLKIQDRPYSQGGQVSTIKYIEQVDPNGNPGQIVVVMSHGNKKQPKEAYFDLSTEKGRKKLETGLMKGNFQGTTDQKHVDGFIGAQYGPDNDYTKYTGTQQKTSRITNNSANGMTFEQYQQMDAESRQKIRSEDIQWSWDKRDVAPPTPTPTASDDDEDESTAVQDFSFEAPDGSNLQFNSSDAKSTLLEEKNDGKDSLRKIGNFEALAGNDQGKGLPNYGMGPKYLKQVRDAGLDPSTEEGFMYAVETVAKNNAINELNLPEPAKFDELDETLKASMIDWEYNTGRDVNDLVHIAQMMKMEKLDQNGNPTGKYEWEDKIDLGGKTLTQLVNAGDKEPVNVKIGDKVYRTAKEALTAIKADDSPISVELTELTPKELANAKHAIMSDETSRSDSDIATYNKTWKYRIDQFK